MLTLVLAVLAVLAFVGFLYPYVIYPHVLKRLPVKPVAKAPYARPVSLLFCAFNEAEVMPRKIANLRDLVRRHPDLEVLAFDDGSTDGTYDALAAAGFIQVVKGAGRSGKASGMKRLAKLARGDILVFTDANVILADDAIANLMPYYADASVGGVCGTLIYASAEGSSMAEVGTAYWRLDEALRSAESDTGNVMGADGSIFSVRRALYPEFPDTVLDDFTVSMSVIFAGRRLIKAPDVQAFENSVCDRGDELRRKARIGARAYHTSTYLRPRLARMAPIDRFKYASRKTMRWFGGAFLIAGIVLTIASAATLSVLLGLAVGIAIVAVLGASTMITRGIAGKLGDAFLSIMATLVGILRAMRGETVLTWSPSKWR